MKRHHKRTPLLGESFNPELMNMGEVFATTADELAHYLSVFSRNNKHVRACFNDLMNGKYAWDNGNDDDDDIQTAHDALNEAECILTDWAQSVERHDYIYFTVDGDFAGFRINVESAIEDADWQYSCDGWREHGTPHKPGDGAGLEVFVNDHGNVTATRYGRNGRAYELFAVV